MFQRDYILRMIEQAGAVLKAVLDLVLRRAAAAGEVEGRLRTTMQQAGFDLEFARLADPASLERMVAPDGSLEPGRGWLIAECLYVDGIDAEMDGDEVRAKQSLEKALRLFYLFDPDTPIPTGFPEAAERIVDIEGRLLNLGNGHTS
jgi:hypothetical protein